MNFLVFGNGSIGKRHTKNLNKLGHKVSTYSFRKRNLINDNTQACNKPKDWNYFLNDNHDAVIIACTTNLHIEIAIEAAKKGKHIYIEKPLSINLDNLNILKTYVKEKNLKIDTGFMLRSHPNLIFLKEFICKGDFGNPLYVRAFVGQNIKDWRENYNYKESYANFRELGGGVVFDLIHELDLVQWLVGEVDDLCSFLLSHPSLEISTETIAQISMRIKGNTLAQVHLDYHRPYFSRKMEFCYDNFVIKWDFLLGKVYLKNEKGIKSLLHEVPNDFTRNKLFEDHMKYFINSIKDSSIKTRSSLDDGISALKLALATHTSFATRSFVKIKKF